MSQNLPPHNREARITPNCCENVAKYEAVFLWVENVYENGDGSVPPVWAVKAKHPEYQSCETFIEVKFCPFCGTAVPEIGRRTGDMISRMKFMRISDGGYYCDTCSERLHACTCRPFEHEWEAIEAPVQS